MRCSHAYGNNWRSGLLPRKQARVLWYKLPAPSRKPQRTQTPNQALSRLEPSQQYTVRSVTEWHDLSQIVISPRLVGP